MVHECTSYTHPHTCGVPVVPAQEQGGIHCRRLLARLCIAREEIAEVVAEQHSQKWQSGSTEEMYASNLSLKNQGIPKASLAFLKELLTISDKAKR